MRGREVNVLYAHKTLEAVEIEKSGGSHRKGQVTKEQQACWILREEISDGIKLENGMHIK